MKRSGAIWVVVGVLAVAALLMYFVVMPQIRGSKTVDDVAEKTGEAVEQSRQTVDQAGQKVEDLAAGVDTGLAARMDRLKAETEAATTQLQALLDKGTPTAEEIAAARARIEAALKAVSEVKLGESADAATAALVNKMEESARAALARLDTLPADPAQAEAAIAEIKSGLEAAPADAVADKPAGTTDTPASENTAENANTEPTAEGTQTAPQTADANTDNSVPTPPAFDVLRVEKDGSTVIAGRAEPESQVEVIDGGKVIASAKADKTGSFATVLDDPLASGDHSIVLKSTSKDGTASRSEEVATVAVPKDEKGELLAMVTKPGEASKILTMPKADDRATETAASDATAASDTQATPSGTDAATTPDGTVATPDLPALSSEIAGNPPVVESDEAAAQPQEMAKADPATASKDAARQPDKPASAPEVMVSAVEFEGDRIFVAGNTRPHATVRVYADNAIVAEVKADESGRFVADGRMPLAVGEHTIRADVLSADGGRVEFRASVPFFRPEGDSAVVASAEDDATTAAPLANPLDKARQEAAKALDLLKDLYADGKTPTPEELAAARSSTEIALKTLSEVRAAEHSDPALAELANKASEQAAKALATLDALPADPDAVKSALGEIEEDVSSALRPATELAARVPSGKPAAEDGEPVNDAAPAEAARTNGDDTVVSDAARPRPAPDAKKDRLPANTADTASDTSADASSSQARESADRAAPQAAEESAAGDIDGQDVAAADQPKLIEQAPLKQSDASVIIRRGDTLWQISRRVYGKGVRYTTIYVANKEQIDDPDRILPGQIFSMPGKWLDNAEELHKQRLQRKD